MKTLAEKEKELKRLFHLYKLYTDAGGKGQFELHPGYLKLEGKLYPIDRPFSKHFPPHEYNRAWAGDSHDLCLTDEQLVHHMIHAVAIPKNDWNRNTLNKYGRSWHLSNPTRWCPYCLSREERGNVFACGTELVQLKEDNPAWQCRHFAVVTSCKGKWE